MIQEHHLPDRVAQALADAYGHSSPSLSAYTNPLT
jgi:hypothetical protein